MNWGKGHVFLLLTAVAIATLATSSVGLSGGISRPQLTNEGCVCHGPGGAGGTPNPNVKILFSVSGNPYVYEAGKEYTINLSAESDVPPGEGNKGGFNIKASDGTFAPTPGNESFVKIVTTTEATHTLEGDQNGRNFSLLWKAPSTNGDSVVFQVFVNTVNGDATPSELDHWNGATYVLMGTSFAVGGGAELTPEQIGVRWLAHWVGIISFIAVFATLVIYYFVLKYGETMHATDHRDRKEK